MAGWVERGSGWVINRIKTAYLHIGRYNPIRGGAYIPLPSILQGKQAIINIKNKDDECLLWALKAWRYPVQKDAQRPSKYPTEDSFNFTGKMDAPDIPSVNLMYITKWQRSHYCYIKSLSRLLYSQQGRLGRHLHFCERCLQGFTLESILAKHRPLCRGASNRPTRFEMPEKEKSTLEFQNYQRQMEAPFVIYADCESIIEKYDTLPPLEKSSTTKTEVHKPCGFSFVIVRSDGAVSKVFLYYGEDCVKQFLLALLQKEREIRQELSQKAPLHMTEEDSKAFHRATKCHICKKDLMRYSAKDEIEVWDPETGEYCGKVHKYKKAPLNGKVSCHKEIMELISTDENNKRIKKWHPRVKKSKEEELKEKPDENNSYYCNESLFREKFRDAVRDHCHITGKFRGAAHNVCNLNFRTNPKRTIIPVVFYKSPRLRCPSSDAGNRRSGRKSEMHPKQHGEVHLPLYWKPQIHRQFPIPLVKR